MTVIDAPQVVNNTLSPRLAECTLAPEFLCVVQRKRVQRPKCVYDGSVGQHIMGHIQELFMKLRTYTRDQNDRSVNSAIMMTSVAQCSDLF